MLARPALFAVLLFACSFPQQRANEQPPRRLFLRNGVILNGRDSVPLRGFSIVIRDGRVESLTTDDRTPAPGSGDSTIDLNGAWVVPGLIDAHAHIGFDRDSSTDANRRAAQRALSTGVTTVRSMGVPGWADVRLRRNIDAGGTPGPRILPSGNGVVPIVSDSWLSDFAEVRPFLQRAAPRDTMLMLSPARPWRITDPAAIDTIVGVHKSRGALWVKILATGRAFGYQADPVRRLFTDAELRAIVIAAKKRGLWVAAHAHGDEGMRAAVAAGVRTIEHGTHASDETLRMMRSRKTCFVSTLTEWENAESAPTAAQRAALRAAAERSARRARALGVTVIVGTDEIYAAGARGVVGELQALSRLGFSPAELLLASTSRAAECLEMGNALGSIAPGYRADLLVLDGSPLENLARLRSPRMILVDGRIAQRSIARLPLKEVSPKSSASRRSPGYLPTEEARTAYHRD